MVARMELLYLHEQCTLLFLSFRSHTNTYASNNGWRGGGGNCAQVLLVYTHRVSFSRQKIPLLRPKFLCVLLRTYEAHHKGLLVGQLD